MNRKLQAVGYEDYANFSLNKPQEVIDMVLWLEDQVIRHYTIQDRVKLHNSNVNQWLKKNFDEYLDDLVCPLTTDQRKTVAMAIDWLLGYAVRLVYAENLPRYQTIKPPAARVHGEKPSSKDNPFEKINFKNPAVRESIESIAELLDVPPHTNPDMVFKAICLIAKNNLSSGSLRRFNTKFQGRKADKSVAMQDIDLGFTTGDYALDDAAKILRLLHIHSLRQLQSQINKAIVKVQTFTADPVTDQRLGKVGR